MVRLPHIFGVAIASTLLLAGAACSKPEAVAEAEVVAEAAPAPELYLRDTYDVTADPAQDLEAAIVQADGRRILLEVGGEWCSWCMLLDKYLETNEDVRAAFARSFIVVKVNYSKEYPNTDFLGQYPEAEGYPQFYILESDGTFLAAQETGSLEEGKGYDRQRMLDFAESWVKS